MAKRIFNTILSLPFRGCLKGLCRFNTLLLLLIFSEMGFAGTIYSFEDGIIPTGFRVKTGTLGIQAQKAKLGTKSLQWNWAAGDTLIAAPQSMSTASVQTNGGITTWIYNSTPVNQKLILRFYEYENSTTRRCSLEVNLNFKGWRCIWASFRGDMGHAGYTLRSMKWEAPKTGSGTILIDYLEFVNDISWERISDAQYLIKNPATDLENYLNVRNVVAPAPPTSISPDQQQAVQTIKQRLDEWYLGNGKFNSNPYFQIRKNAFDSYVQSTLNKTTDLNLTTLADGTVSGPGLFPLDFYGQTIDGVAVTTFREINEKYLLQLAYDAIKNNKTSSKDLILKIFDWYYDQGWADGSSMGKLRFEMLRSSGFYHAAYLMRNAMSPEQLNRVIETEKWLSLWGKTNATSWANPGENTDQIRTLLLPKLFLILSMKNELEQSAALQGFVRYANNALSPAGGYLDCIKPDFSGYHHRGAYYSAYYPEALYAACQAYYYLSGTSYSLSNQTYSTLKNALLTFSFMCADYDVPAALTGRFPAQTEIMDNLLAAYAYLALSTPVPDAELTAAFKRLWNPTSEPMKTYISRVKSDITFKNGLGEVEKMVELASSTIPAGKAPVGSKYLPFSGLMVSRLPSWVVRSKGFSKYIWDFEASSTENRYGRYLSYGQVELSKTGTSLCSYHPEQADWDWSHIPGTTARNLTADNLDFVQNPNLLRNFSDQAFLGGVVLDTACSVFANYVHDNTFDLSFYAKKSVFQFDSVFYCLGTGIRDNDLNRPIHTTLFQNLKMTANDQVSVNGNFTASSVSSQLNPVLIDNYKIAYLVKEGTVDMTAGSNFYTAYINHGLAPTAARYAYLIMPDASAGDIALYNSSASPLQILRQDDTVHAVYDQQKKRLQAAIFTASSSLSLGKITSVNIPLLLSMQQANDTLNLVVTDPDMHRPTAANIDQLNASQEAAVGTSSTIHLELEGCYLKTNQQSDAVVTNLPAKTIVEFTAARDGASYRVQLRRSDTTILADQPSDTPIKMTVLKKTVLVETANNFKFDFQLYNALGELVLSGSAQPTKTSIQTSGLATGVYVLNVKTAQSQKQLKLLR